jgi:hypothetical protein
VFAAAVTFFAEPLLGNDRRDTYGGIHINGRDYEVGLCTVTYIPSFMNIGSGIQKLIFFVYLYIAFLKSAQDI